MFAEVENFLMFNAPKGAFGMQAVDNLCRQEGSEKMLVGLSRFALGKRSVGRGFFREKLTGKGGGEDGLAEAVGAGDLAVEFGFEVVDGGGAGFDFGNDLVLFGEGCQGERDTLDLRAVQTGASYAMNVLFRSGTDRVRV